MIVFLYDSLLVRWLLTHVLANALDVDIHDQIFAATNAERFDCVYRLLAALQPSLNRNCCKG